MTEEKLIDHIISRLEPQILDYVEFRHPQTASNLLQIIDKYEERFLNRKIKGSSWEFRYTNPSVNNRFRNRNRQENRRETRGNNGYSDNCRPRREFNRFESQGVADNRRFDGRRRGGEFDHRFHNPGGRQDQPGLTHVLYHEIETGDNGPVVSRPYRYDRVKQGIIDYHIEKILQEGTIRPIRSPYAPPVVLPRKNNGLPPDSPEAVAPNFQKVIDIILKPVIGRFVMVYMDDVSITSSSYNKHIDHLNQVLTLFRDARVNLNKEKCHFVRDKLKYLGLIISMEGIETDNSKVKAIAEMKPPKYNKEVSKFLGMAGWYQKFIPHYADICEPLYRLKKKGAKFNWSTKAQDAFDKIKRALKEAEVLQLPNFQEQFNLFTDASGVGIGAVLN
ncbi:retrovirus-related Pol polyprotein from transposon 297 [Trichonephila clavipes]|uniref:RNA-directed DNA polymerase n=1 Tax=Trichonephila clavipes TaxID=2585209 RepID=A0A8X7BG62_TRICX|nr:retrovirus-related Pol polyprotein from transposon 297 [Trichonephila clavipes]